jgi:hypothetical protein
LHSFFFIRGGHSFGGGFALIPPGETGANGLSSEVTSRVWAISNLSRAKSCDGQCLNGSQALKLLLSRLYPAFFNLSEKGG